ncbi:MAG: hypothetical protein UR79_C0001G0121 [Candidatus Campbellbacteria bacterium GW2011_GWD1_35_49]|nr:MAG: hypothetical protein UR58_C0001G0166 [Candidatus Campbellbacteria bacterium GW2011_OD1_34_28]KKP75352.1 MAG: hypothetical protein UR74_C0001G0208 [Candidatus Campbellbacteria bacterium GW2011_GWD2_35_24]KKP76087.1 MAG: hypothetical protein UR75_C0001G0121 [Candidatus Campbellbacteria bacterium GW2011_GWC2_35_28]KKP77276.1 MAG: hypothetical protein UR76_C0001G0121 [Candidatus Campbellbacteria bacterium GW2011_GWC1_35_31]KKP79205.1 MAG: hypothetical protein UR79_C0001G0121 [Candidatus Cam
MITSIFSVIVKKKSIEDLIKKGGHSHFNPHIVGLLQQEEIHKAEVKKIALFRFSKEIVSQQAILEMHLAGYRPATAYEVLCLNVKKMGTISIMALGTIKVFCGRKYVLSVLAEGGFSCVNLVEDYDEYHGRDCCWRSHHFAAVRR